MNMQSEASFIAAALLRADVATFSDDNLSAEENQRLRLEMLEIAESLERRGEALQ